MYSRYNLDLDYKIPAQARGRSQKLTVSLNAVIKNIAFVNLIKILQGDRNKFLSMDYRELSVIAKSCGIIDERGNWRSVYNFLFETSNESIHLE